MLVARRPAGPSVDEVAAAAAAGARAVLIAGAPGVGKTSVLAAAAARIEAETGRSIVWVSGGIVASEGHLARLLAEAASDRPRQIGPGISLALDSVCRQIAADAARPRLFAIDDFDTLIFKRERVAFFIRNAIAAEPAARLLATCHVSALGRLMTTLSLASHVGSVVPVTISAFDERAARDLIRRRTPRLSQETTAAVIGEAGGHPAALVYLARLAELRLADRARPDATTLAQLFEGAAEFAGAVYAESWALLGPQQRAILWQLGSAGAPATAADIARRIALSASHVSAQLTRLIDEGLVLHAKPRAHYTVAPLLARWIAKRATPGGHVLEKGVSAAAHVDPDLCWAGPHSSTSATSGALTNKPRLTRGAVPHAARSCAHQPRAQGLRQTSRPSAKQLR